MSRCLQWYPKLGGIFFDEMSSSTATSVVKYYKSLQSFVVGKGKTFTGG